MCLDSATGFLRLDHKKPCIFQVGILGWLLWGKPATTKVYPTYNHCAVWSPKAVMWQCCVKRGISIPLLFPTQPSHQTGMKKPCLPFNSIRLNMEKNWGATWQSKLEAQKYDPTPILPGHFSHLKSQSLCNRCEIFPLALGKFLI